MTQEKNHQKPAKSLQRSWEQGQRPRTSKQKTISSTEGQAQQQLQEINISEAQKSKKTPTIAGITGEKTAYCYKGASSSSSLSMEWGDETPTTRRVCFSFAAYAKNVIDHLRRCQVPISRGLSDEEFQKTETTFGFQFPPDLRSILQEGLPVGVGFPNWRSGQTQQLKMMMDLPMSGLSCEIQKGSFWCRHWGTRPANPEQALQLAKSFMAKIPRLVPIFSHCYIPSSPNLAGNPVFFIFHRDIFYCGYDVADFFQREAFVPHNFKHAEFDSEPRFGPLILAPDPRNPRNPEIAEIAVPARKSVSEDAFCSSRAEEKAQAESLTRSAGNSPRRVISRYRYFHETPLSNTILSKFTMRAPPWVAKAARKIEFWSQLVENKESLNTASLQAPFSSSPLPPQSNVKLEEQHSVRLASKIWLSRYFGEIAANLRRAGWKEEEITEMLNPSVRVYHENRKMQFGENLARNMDLLSVSLRKAGWSATDVFESLNMQRFLAPHSPMERAAPYLAVP